MRLVLEPKSITKYIEALEKGRKMPIGTVSHGYKKFGEGDWRPVPKGRDKAPEKDVHVTVMPKKEIHERAATHYGICQWCNRRQKLPGGVLADHGFTIEEGWYGRQGTCKGSRHKPYETHTDMITASVAEAEEELVKQEALLAGGDTLQKWVVLEKEHIGGRSSKMKTVEKQMLRVDIIASTKKYINDQKERLATWKEQPLTPIEGTVIDPSTGLRDTTDTEKKKMLYLQQYGETTVNDRYVYAYTNKLEFGIYDRLIRDGFVKLIDKGTNRDGHWMKIDISDNALTLFPRLEKPIRGGKIVTKLWEQLKVDGELTTKKGSSQQYFAAEELAQFNSDRVEIIKNDYNNMQITLRKVGWVAKSLDGADDLMKGRKADPIGTIKVWHGKKFIKQAKGWVPVVAGKRGRPAKTATPAPAATPAVDPDQAKKDAAKKEALIVTLKDILDTGTISDSQKEKYIAKLKELGVTYEPPKDEEYIKNADLNNLKTKWDFSSYDNYKRYADKIYQQRESWTRDDWNSEHDVKMSRDSISKLVAQSGLDIDVKPVSAYTQALAHSFTNDLSLPDDSEKWMVLHELGHVIQFHLQKNKIAYDAKLEDIVYSPSSYGLMNGAEMFAESLQHYYLDKNYAKEFPELYAALEKTIPAEYDKLARDILNFGVSAPADSKPARINKIKSLKFAMDGKEMTAEAKASKAELDRLMWKFTEFDMNDAKLGDVILHTDYGTQKSSWMKVHSIGRMGGAVIVHVQGKDGSGASLTVLPGQKGHKAMPVPEEIINKIKDLPGVTVETEEIPQADAPKTAKPNAQGVATAPVAPKTYAESKGLAKYDAGRLDALVQATTKRNRMSYGQDVQYQGTYFRNMTGKTGKLLGIGDGGYALVQFGSEVKTAAWRDLKAVGSLKPHSMYDGLTADNVYQAEGQFKTDLDATMNQKIGSSNITYLDLCKEFKKHGFTMNVVGGTVRDILAGKKAGDVDFIFDGTDRELAATLGKINPAWAQGAVTNAHLGLMSFSDGKDTVDITPVHKFITETNTMAKGWTLKDDAQSRDLAMNSLHVDPISGVAVDGTGKGLKDIETNTINFTDMKILEHTPVYLLRAFKFLARGYAISPESDAALNKNIKQIEKCSPRRISSFLTRQIGEKDGEKGLLKVKDLISARDPQLWQSKFEATYRDVMPKFRGK